jgi:hypothetical protein
MSGKRKLTLNLINLHCFLTDEKVSDEIFLIVNNRKIWPAKQKYTSVKPRCTEIATKLKEFEAGTTLEIELWDFDYLSSHDLLGKFTILLDEPGGPYQTDMIQNREKTRIAKYSIEWELDYI